MPTVTDAQRQLDELLIQANLVCVFQPIFSFRTGELHAYEGLIRGPEGHPLQSPPALFEAADRAGRLLELELLCVKLLCQAYLRQRLGGLLFLNSSPMSLQAAARDDVGILNVLRATGIDPQRVVIELSERHPVEDFDDLRAAVRFFSERGCKLAVDDLGAGYAGLRVWAELQPDYVKIDRHFIESIQQGPVKREFVRSICDISQATGCQVVAEGVESEAELNTLRSLGCHHVQGFLTGRPSPTPATQPEVSVVATMDRLPTPLVRARERAGALSLNPQSVHPQQRAEQVIDHFQRDSGLLAVPVVDNLKVCGLLERHSLLDLFSQRYGREVYGRKPIAQIMNPRPLCVEEDQPLAEVSRRLTEGQGANLSQHFVVTCRGEFVGLARTQELLARITEQQLRAARYSNPLTLLPGNVPIYEHIDELLSLAKPFWVAYFDLDHFKPFNDCYGYSRGDDVIRLLGELLTAYGRPGKDFVGHVGGDDFVAVYQSEDWQERVTGVLDDFDRKVLEHYDPAHRAAGGIEVHDRQGQAVSVGLLSLSVGVVCPDPASCRSHHAVAALATDAKREAKRQLGSALFVSRRRRPMTAGFEPAANQVA